MAAVVVLLPLLLLLVVVVRGSFARSLASRYAALYTIGYEVAVTCSRPADDITHSVTRASIDYTGEGSPDIGRTI